MKAIAVYPGQKNSVHLADLPKASLDEVPNGRGVLVRLLRCGVDRTDKEINAAEYGAVLGTGTIGLLAVLILRLRGIEVTAFGRTPKPYLNSDLVEGLGARYINTQDQSLRDAAATYGPFDLIYEATGFAPIVFEAMEALGKNGVLVLSSVTGGNQMVEVPAAKINLEFVLGNKVMVGTVNGNREYFEAAIREIGRASCRERV